MNNNSLRLYILKYLSYALVLIAVGSIQSAPFFPSIFGARPILIYPCVVAIAMNDGELVGGLFGAFGGLICDHFMTVIFGFNGIVLLLCGATIGLLTIYYIQNSLKNALILSSLSLLIRELLVLVFGYLIFGYDNPLDMVLRGQLPSFIYTVLLTPIFYFLFRKLSLGFNARVNK